MMTVLPPPVLIVFFAVVGACFGSFGNVCAERLAAGKPLGGRSACDGCGKMLRSWELVPVLSWCVLGGRCIRCRASIPLRYTLVELLTALVFVGSLLLSRFDMSAGLLLGISFWTMLLIVIIDLETHLIPDALTLILAACALLLQWSELGTFAPVPALIGLCFFGIQWLASKGRWIGSGDVLLATALGLFLVSWQAMLLMVWFAYVIGTLVIAALYLSGHLGDRTRIAFGPFLIAGAVVSSLFADRIIAALF